MSVDLPNTFAVTRVEGGNWEPFVPCQLVHSIMFENGSIWDASNGWRETPPGFSTPDILRAIWARPQ